MTAPVRGRFAPSTTGEAHPGTLLAALLAWLDARSRGGTVLLRLEDLDPERCKPAFAAAMQDALAWLGLHFDTVQTQSARHLAHAAALDALAAAGLLYACGCSRQTLKAHGVRAPDGAWVYPNTCRTTPRLDAAAWRTSLCPLRVELPAGAVTPRELGGLDLTQVPAQAMGDPIVRRRDGAVAYQLAVVVDDASADITDVVRGRDIAPSTGTQVLLQRLLALPTPRYRHHLLLVEPQGGKLAKLHGSVGFSALRESLTPAQLCGFLAQVCGLRASAAPCRPAELLADFAWERVRTPDQIVVWDGGLRWLGAAAGPAE